MRICLLLIAYCLLVPGCTVDKRVVDQPRVEYARKYAADMKEAAQFAIMFTRENKKSEYLVNKIKDGKKRKLVANFGSSFSVIYRSSDRLDSVVVFESLSIRYGVKKYYYDFAARERSFENDTSASYDYMFLKVTDRIYYARSPIPMM